MPIKKIAFSIDGALEVYREGIGVGLKNTDSSAPLGTPGDTFIGGMMLMVSAAMYLGGDQATMVRSMEANLPMVWAMIEEMMRDAPSKLKRAMHLEDDDADSTKH